MGKKELLEKKRGKGEKEGKKKTKHISTSVHKTPC